MTSVLLNIISLVIRTRERYIMLSQCDNPIYVRRKEKFFSYTTHRTLSVRETCLSKIQHVCHLRHNRGSLS